MTRYELWAPHPDTEAVIYVPQPALRDSVNLESRVLAKVAADGQQYTNVKRQPDQQLFKWNFRFSRPKALEFLEFLKLYSASKWKVVTGDGDTIIGYFRVNPTQFNVAHRAVVTNSLEDVLLDVEFLKVE
jgi:hypothetical protein